ncbi:hypothetical protein JHJ32_02340 [Parapedobacter sp. ISTM3]|uniref:hypothetical protein n=1 Tax=Parapedobacter sp. ISTM3 TaxID=2800130 RepID=UPI0019083434|nr:hypothetical protein [Parapedobacter sp. ISTM3]MBK1438814.1 hypothetical protein [Parapedobacter sp. ISTM3]
MKTLMPYEKRWIAKRLKIYSIKYAEIYNEVYDHMVSACEHKRQSGDNRPILSLFQEAMDQDIGSHKGIAWMTEDREALLKEHLLTALKQEFKSYFDSAKILWACAAYVAYFTAMQSLQLDLRWHLIVLAGVLALPFCYLLVVGTKNGYFRTITHKRKTSLVNTLMIRLTQPAALGFYAGFFSIPQLLTLFTSDSETGTQLTKGFVHFLGHPGMSVLITVALIYVASFVKIVNTDYRRLIAHV